MQRPRIVIVDDSIAVVSLLCQVLDAAGWVVVPCPDGSVAGHVIESTGPDVVFLDVRLDTPDRGWHILRELRASPWGRNLPVVLCASGRFLANMPSDLNMERVVVVEKPFDLTDLTGRITCCLSAGAMEADSAVS